MLLKLRYDTVQFLKIKKIFNCLQDNCTEGKLLMKLSKKELSVFVSVQNKVFDIVRLVDVSMTTQYFISEDGSIREQPFKCYAVWNKDRRCENCVSAKAYGIKGRMTKFEFVDDDMYFVISSYAEVDNEEYMIEMVAKLSDETIWDAHGKNKFIKTIKERNRKLYLDSLTGAYNRRYYDEQLTKLRHISAIAMIDVDDFKKINDTFGHAEGDRLLKKIAKTISSCIRSSDALVRMGGDEFLLVFQDISQEMLKIKLKNILQAVSEIHIDEHPDVKTSISIGAVYDDISAIDMNDLADKYLYKAKENKNSIVLGKE